jgi:hypothetical protein
MSEPSSVTALRKMVQLYDVFGMCPTVAQAEHSCVWTCPECKEGRPGTVGAVSTGDYGRRRPTICAVKEAQLTPEGREALRIRILRSMPIRFFPNRA